MKTGKNLASYDATEDGPATRGTSGEVLNAIAEVNPNFWGGSADLSGSNKTMIDWETGFASDNYEGKNIIYGIVCVNMRWLQP